MKRLVSCWLLLISLHSFSQTIDVDKTVRNPSTINNLPIAGIPYTNAKFVRLVSGSPFFNEQMMRGILISKDNTEYRNVITPLREVALLDTVNQKNYHFIFSDHIESTDKVEKGFYQILQKGKAGLYAYHKKVLKEAREYNSATYEQSIETYVIYYVLLGGQWKKINKIKDLPSLLSDKKSEVQEYISSKGLSGYKQADVESVINYYNTLFTDKK